MANRLPERSGVTEQYEIAISNQQSLHAVDEPRLVQAAELVLQNSPYFSAAISLAVVDDPTIHELNRRHLDHDWPTDVLSFVLEDDDTHLEGEVVISADTAATAAEELGIAAGEEQLLYVIHGMLHLVGYNDKSAVEAKEMRAAETRYLQQFGVEPSREGRAVNADIQFWISLVSLVAACLAAIAARSLHSFSRHELEEIAQLRQNPERFAEILRSHESVALGVEMVVMMIVALSAVSGFLWALHAFDWLQLKPWALFAIAVFVLGQLVGIATVWLPWSVSRIGAARFLYATWPLWRFVGTLAMPLVWSARAIDALLHRMFGRTELRADEESIEEEIRTIVSEGHREGLLEEEAREMIEGVIELGDAVVSHIMTPRTDIHMVQLSTSWEEVVESIIDSGHTRVPIYDKTRDDIVGILYSKDLLPELAKGSDEPHRPVAELLRKPLFVPETKPVDDLLKLFLKSRTHIAVVLDEYGGVSGLVTIEDVLEEIVGEIDDEYDQKSEEVIRRIDEDSCETLGRAHIDEINELMGFDLPEDADFDTIGGFVFAEFGRVPAPGETITWKDSVRVTVLEASRRRVNRVRLERIRKESLEAV